MAEPTLQAHQVVYIITQLELGGAQKVCLNLKRGVSDARWQTRLYAGAGGILDETVKNEQAIELITTLRRAVGIRSLWQETQTLLFLAKRLRALRKENPRIIVHTHSTKAGIVGRWAAWLARIPVRVHTIHGFSFHAHQSKVTWLAMYFTELVTSFITTHFVCVSSADQTTAVQLFPGFKKKQSIIRAAVDFTPFEQQRTDRISGEKKIFIFGTISCFKPQKNLFDLLRAFAWTYDHNPNIRCEIIGDGPLRGEITAWIKEHELEQVITLHGWQEQVAPIMMGWDAFVLSSLWEGLPCAIIEARLLKLPIITYDTGGIRDVVSSELNGIICPQKAWPSLAEAMHRMSLDRQLHTRLSSYQDDLEAYRNSTMIAEHKKLYERLLAFYCV